MLGTPEFPCFWFTVDGFWLDSTPTEVDKEIPVTSLQRVNEVNTNTEIENIFMNCDYIDLLSNQNLKGLKGQQ